MIQASVMQHVITVATTLALACGSAAAQEPAPTRGAPPAAKKVENVRVVGCLKRTGADWLLTAATDPVPNAPPGRGAAATPPAAAAPPPPGRNQYKLIGVAEFNLPSRENQRVAVTGLFITATPVSRINITTVVPVASACEASGG